MTLEEKAKAYDEALERAKQLPKISVDYDRFTIERIFPELKESDDERIRKGMLQVFKDYEEPEYEWCKGVKVKECIAWLEKLGESNPYSGVSFEYDGHIWGMRARDNGVDILCDKRIIEHLEKQDKQNYEFHGIAKSRPAKGTLKKLVDEIENVDNANKVEPKFKI